VLRVDAECCTNRVVCEHHEAAIDQVLHDLHFHRLRALVLCIAVCCSVLQCVAVCCSVLQCVAVCYSVLQCLTVCCSVVVNWVWLYIEFYRPKALVFGDAACCSVLHSILQYVAVCCSVLQHVAVLLLIKRLVSAEGSC